MAAIVGLAESQVSSVVRDITTDTQPVFVSNLNAPRQIVIAGAIRAIEDVHAKARSLGAHKAGRLRVAVPSHGPLMESVSLSLRRQLLEMEVRDPKYIYISNMHTCTVRTAQGILDDLSGNIAHTVRWHEVTVVAQELGTEAFIEMPPGHVLSDLVRENLHETIAYPLSSTNPEWIIARTLR